MISEKLKELRQERGMSVRELAERSGLSQPYIWQIERGKALLAESVPSEWEEGSVSAEITDLEFIA